VSARATPMCDTESNADLKQIKSPSP